MEITRKNYEVYFVDYLEGKLDEKLVDAFIEFLEKNPDLKEELKLFEGVQAIPDTATFSKKNQLYKEKYDEENEFNKAAIANLEGEILGKEKREFENYLSRHPEKQKDAALFTQTILKADENIHYEQKNKLYKKPGRTLVLLWAGRVAAILILAFAIFSVFRTNDKTSVPENRLAQLEDKSEQVEVTPQKKAEPKQVQTQPVIKEEFLQPKTTQNIHENKNVKLEAEKLTPVRIPVENLPAMNARMASLEVQAPQATLATMTLIYDMEIPDEERLLADNLKEKFDLKKLTKAGLNLVTSISNERFTYETNDKGKVTEYNYESRLLAFSIPSSKPAGE
jgi:hypothetical protein